jgi:hypothetical protein
MPPMVTDVTVTYTTTATRIYSALNSPGKCRREAVAAKQLETVVGNGQR